MNIQEIVSKLLDLLDEHGDIPMVVGVKGVLYWDFHEPRFVVGEIKGQTKVAILP